MFTASKTENNVSRGTIVVNGQQERDETVGCHQEAHDEPLRPQDDQVLKEAPPFALSTAVNQSELSIPPLCSSNPLIY